MTILQIKRGNLADLPTGEDILKPGEMYFAEDVNIILVGKNDQSTAQFIESSSYKRYVASLTQAGTDDPVAMVLENTLDGEVVWTRQGPGLYKGTLVDAFPDAKTIIFFNRSSDLDRDAVINSSLETLTDSSVSVVTWNGAALADGILQVSSIEIRVYS